MEKDIKFYELEIISSIEKINRYIENMNFWDFLDDEKTFDACCMQLQHIWECWIKLEKIVWNNYKNIPFSDMRWFRNRITHDYVWIDNDIVWSIIQSSLPGLKKLLEIK